MVAKVECQCYKRDEGSFAKRTKTLTNNFTHKHSERPLLKLIKLILSLKLSRDMCLINGRSWQYYPLFPFSVVVYVYRISRWKWNPMNR